MAAAVALANNHGLALTLSKFERRISHLCQNQRPAPSAARQIPSWSRYSLCWDPPQVCIA